MKALPRPNETSSPRTNVREPDASGTTLSLTEAVSRFDVSRATLSRKLRAGEIPGAHKVPGPKGDEYRLPIVSLQRLGYRDRQAEVEEIEEAVLKRVEPAPDVSALAMTVTKLFDELNHERLRLEAAEQDRKDVIREREEARIETARLSTQLAAEEQRREQAETEIERLRSLKWWQRRQ